ncbi:MAG: dihydroorotase [Leptolyngbya foveolarum]|uniref:Dihydroorotase n=1 Tax=Leptolyngbya foveolarum TaxID=47253 RepID=A0A2W4TVY9_9CYAN|nr:MAG: dihydroorotase [Leptolyngbya foveolarum]
MTTLIKQAYLLGADEGLTSAEGTADVLIEAGKVVAIAPTLPNSFTNRDLAELDLVIEAQGQYLGPGLIDLYSQSGEPGYETRETYKSIQQAAAAGGFTRVGLLPNTQPAVDSVSAIAAVLRANESGDRASQAKLMPWAAVTLGAAGEQLTELADLAAAGCLGFTDGQPLADTALLRRLLEYAQPLQKPIAIWPCDLNLSGSGVAREGVEALRLGLAGVSAIAETTALSTLLECVLEIATPVHIMRVSTARSVALIRRAKAEGLPISASVAWHHLIFDTADLKTYDPNLRHDPPLGTAADRQALIAGVAEGVIDAIAIDHSPYTYEEKTVAFDAAPPGAIGLALALPVLWQTFVASGQWSAMQLWQALSQRPAECLGLAPNRLAVGNVAELTLFDPSVEWQATTGEMRSQASNTPWLNQTIQGRVIKTWI